jgi:hypothetical protein
VSSARSRVRRLEASSRGGTCPGCKLHPGGPGYVVLEDREENPKDPNARCPECGRFLWQIIRVVYEDEPGGGGGEPCWPDAAR